MNITAIKSALVSGLIMGVLAMVVIVVQNGSIFNLDWHTLVNAGVMGLLTSLASLLKTAGTTNTGHFLGAVRVR